jgi:hypothetical protein
VFSISELARKHAPWSFSKMEMAESCPAQFRHKVILKTAAAPMPSDNKVGIVAHTILEHRVKGTPAHEARKNALDQSPLTSQESEALRMLDESMEDFLKRFDTFCKREGVHKILSEEEWAFTDAYKKTGFFDKDVFFRGKMDLGAVTRSQDLFMIDHKSGMAKPLERDQKKRQQLQAYAVLALVNVPNIQGVRGGIHFMQGSPELRLQWTAYIPAARVRELYVPWLFGRINSAADNLSEPFEARPAKKWPCAWCQYQADCPEYQSLKARWDGAQG